MSCPNVCSAGVQVSALAAFGLGQCGPAGAAQRGSLVRPC
jgi:hypothetical protein